LSDIANKNFGGYTFPDNDDSEARGFWTLALDIEDKIVTGYGLLNEDLYAVEDIYYTLKNEIAPKVLKESLKR